MNIQSGLTIGRYLILEQLGAGGMSFVFRAQDTRLQRDVAIKFIRRDVFSPNIVDLVFARFEREAKVLARLSHPNIVTVLDFGDYLGSPFLVLELIVGGTLKNQLGKAFTWNEAARLLLPMVRALDYAHNQGIVHRDFKPSNILLTATGEPKLSDFGIAKILEGQEGGTLTGTGIGLGTPEYMAPEQGLGREVDGRADIYAMGVVFYELITGRKPFQADTPMAVVFKHLTDPFPNPKQFVPGLPDRVIAVINQAVEKEPANRYKNMAEFGAAIENVLATPNATFTGPRSKRSANSTWVPTPMPPPKPAYKPGPLAPVSGASYEATISDSAGAPKPTISLAAFPQKTVGGKFAFWQRVGHKKWWIGFAGAGCAILFLGIGYELLFPKLGVNPAFIPPTQTLTVQATAILPTDSSLNPDAITPSLTVRPTQTPSPAATLSPKAAFTRTALPSLTPTLSPTPTPSPRPTDPPAAPSATPQPAKKPSTPTSAPTSAPTPAPTNTPQPPPPTNTSGPPPTATLPSLPGATVVKRPTSTSTAGASPILIIPDSSPNPRHSPTPTPTSNLNVPQSAPITTHSPTPPTSTPTPTPVRSSS